MKIEDNRGKFFKSEKGFTNSLLLIHLDNKKEVVLFCDVSHYGIGAILSHKTEDGDHLTAFTSHFLTKTTTM